MLLGIRQMSYYLNEQSTLQQPLFELFHYRLLPTYWETLQVYVFYLFHSKNEEFRLQIITRQ